MVHGIKPILFVEDDTIETMKMKRVFSKFDVQNPLLFCKNGQEAILELNKSIALLPCLIILDLNMPLMDGMEFLKLIKSHEKWRIIPVVVFSTSNNPNDINACYLNQVAGYFVKPLDYYDYERQVQHLKNYWEHCAMPL